MNEFDRRKDPKPRPTLEQVMRSMEEVANVHYGKEISANILSVFNTLPTGDKRTFLRRGYAALKREEILLRKNGLQDVVIDDETRIDMRSVAEERKTISELNYQEQASFKSWIYQAMFAILLFFIMVAFVISSLSSNRAEEASLLRHISTVFQLLFP